MTHLIDKDALVAEIERRFLEDYNSDDIEMDEVAQGVLASLKYFIDTLEVKEVQEEPVSEDLEEAINAYIGYAPEVDECSSVYGKRQAFKAGAKWKEQQMINGAVETIIDSKPNDYGEFIPIVHVKVGSSYKYGEKVRIIIIKEDICG